MEKSDHTAPDQPTQFIPTLKPCPFCAGRAEIVTAYEPTRFGIWCSVCHGGFLPVHETQTEIMALWNRRSGSISAAGGRATKGVSTPRKRRACRRNLALARQSKKIIRIKAEIEEAVARLLPFREAEVAQAEAAAAARRARLKALEPRILADPGLRQVYDLVKRRQADDVVGPAVNGG